MNVQTQIATAIAQGHPKQKSIMTILEVSKDRGEAWARAVADWDVLKGMMG